MPTISSGSVLVTGANGYIAVWIVKTLLEQGYSVRGTVRSPPKGSHLKETFKEYGARLQVVVVEDMITEGAFDEAVKGVVGIIHTASPVHTHADDPDELIVPAVGGTLSVLRSALVHGTSVKRLVITSSCATVVQEDPNPRVFDEESFNDLAVKEVELKGREARPIDKYRASKTLAERAAWSFVEERERDIGWDLVVLNPPWVFGPVLQHVAANDPQNLNTSMLEWFNNVVKRKRDDEFLASIGTAWVDVRDLALAHVLALQKEAAGGNRFIISAGPYKWQDLVSAAHAIDPSLPPGNTSYEPSTAAHHARFDASKADQCFGFTRATYRSMEATTADILKQFKQNGWIEA
ncbi:hypothetical protein PHLCEN_2v944 [Hermanssonia centrifuga]|uniref:NAD-dependent epimerase/dehydratase domain-containing protein n=1 Tax=Hermanssonia centrifuga TaxID=98765 RepID=A0A2R6S4K3_9APHY|nr:hypothetical protein PHLCEN_2v944 [Hermanssonia centrifuga]